MVKITTYIWHFIFCALFLAGLDRLTSAQSEDNNLPFDKFLQEQHYGPVATDVLHNQQTFHVKINGKDILLELDSGSSSTYVTRDTAWYLGLKMHPTGETDFGRDGRQMGSVNLAPIDNFTVNGWPINRESEIKVFPHNFNALVASGVMGFDYLKINSAIILAGRSGFLLRPGAPTQSASVTPFMRKSGFRAVPLRIFHDRLVADGQIDGHPFIGQIDCSSVNTLFQEEFPKKFGIATGSTRTRGVEDEPSHPTASFLSSGLASVSTIPLRTIVPTTMTLGSVPVAHFEILAGHFQPLVEMEIDGILGRDFLFSHDAVIDAGASTLWLK